MTSDNSISSTTASTLSVSLNSTDVQRSSSVSSGDCRTTKERKKSLNSSAKKIYAKTSILRSSNTDSVDQLHLLKLMQLMVLNYDAQNKRLQLEVTKEKRRRTEELTCVVKSLMCLEAKLKADMKLFNQRLLEKDAEICRLVQQNRALRKHAAKLSNIADEDVRLEKNSEYESDCTKNNLFEDCLMLEALQCYNCKKLFYDVNFRKIRSNSWSKNGKRTNDDNTSEHSSMSDDTVSSSFYGARHSVRYTSKRTPGTYHDYMHSRLTDELGTDNNSEKNIIAIEQKKLENNCNTTNMFSKRKSDSEHYANQQNSTDLNKGEYERAVRICIPKENDCDDERENGNVYCKPMEWSEASPKQIYEASTDDWYASASDQEEINSTPSKSYSHGAINPVLECVNQILLQQSLEESAAEAPTNKLQFCNDNNNLDKQIQSNTVKSQLHLPIMSYLPRANNQLLNHNTQNTHNGHSTCKRVHFSTKNSMVHVPRNEGNKDDRVNNNSIRLELLSSFREKFPATNYFIRSPHESISVNSSTKTLLDSINERTEILNYESIYSNEYEPIGSDRNSSNLYVDMESTTKMLIKADINVNSKISKTPPALPPKPSNLLKIRKSLKQQEKISNESLQRDCSESVVESDYCSISEVNIRSVQIVADVHNVPECETDISRISPEPPESEVEVSTMVSDDTCATSRKTDEIEEILADIPKLPNVEAIIAPRTKKCLTKQQSDYLTMAPKADLAAVHLEKSQIPSIKHSIPNSITSGAEKSCAPIKLHNVSAHTPSQKIQHFTCEQQYNTRHNIPNILTDINKFISKSSPSSTNHAVTPPKTTKMLKTPQDIFLINLENNSSNLPLQAEFDWYNLDIEYGKTPSLNQPDLLRITEHLKNGQTLTEIHEDHECVASTADEYNLDEEFNLNCEKTSLHSEEGNSITTNDAIKTTSSKILNFPLALENSPLPGSLINTKANKIKKNLANFEKFIEGSGLSTKALPNKRKFNCPEPFV